MPGMVLLCCRRGVRVRSWVGSHYSAFSEIFTFAWAGPEALCEAVWSVGLMKLEWPSLAIIKQENSMSVAGVTTGAMQQV